MALIGASRDGAVRLLLVCLVGVSVIDVPREGHATYAQSAVARGSLRGVVVDDATGPERPIPFAVVTAAPSIGPAWSTIAEWDGVFEFSALPAGTYTLTAHKAGYGVATYVRGSARRLPTPVTVSASGIADIIIRIRRGAVIAGRVLDRFGNPIVGAQLQLYIPKALGSESRLEIGEYQRIVSTDDRGAYRFFEVPEGVYAILVRARLSSDMTPVYSMTSEDVADIQRILAAGDRVGTSRPHQAAITPRAVMYVPTYYPRVTDERAASLVSIASGEEFVGADITMNLAAAVAVSGLVTRPDGRSAHGAMVRVLPHEGSNVALLAATSDDRGRFHISSLPPGRYRVIAADTQSRGRGGWAVEEAVVSDQDVTVHLVLQPGASLGGRIALDPDCMARLPQLPEVTVSLTNVDAGRDGYGPFSSSARVGSSGAFAFTGVLPGRYLLGVSVPSAASWSLVSATVAGVDHSDIPLTLTPGSTVTDAVLCIGSQGSIRGIAVDGVDRPVGGYVLVVFSTDRRHWTRASRRIRSMRIPDSGMYHFADMPSGEYYVGVVAVSSPRATMDASLLEELSASALRVVLANGAHVKQDIRVR